MHLSTDRKERTTTFDIFKGFKTFICVIEIKTIKNECFSQRPNVLYIQEQI